MRYVAENDLKCFKK